MVTGRRIGGRIVREAGTDMCTLLCMSCLHIFEISPLSVVSFAIIFSHSGSYPFILLIASFAVQMILSLIRSHCLFLFLFPLL